MEHYKAMQEVKGQALTFEKTIRLTEDDKIINIINYQHYNKIAKSKTIMNKKGANKNDNYKT